MSLLEEAMSAFDVENYQQAYQLYNQLLTTPLSIQDEINVKFHRLQCIKYLCCLPFEDFKQAIQLLLQQVNALPQIDGKYKLQLEGMQQEFSCEEGYANYLSYVKEIEEPFPLNRKKRKALEGSSQDKTPEEASSNLSSKSNLERATEEFLKKIKSETLTFQQVSKIIRHVSDFYLTVQKETHPNPYLKLTEKDKYKLTFVIQSLLEDAVALGDHQAKVDLKAWRESFSKRFKSKLFYRLPEKASDPRPRKLSQLSRLVDLQNQIATDEIKEELNSSPAEFLKYFIASHVAEISTLFPDIEKALETLLLFEMGMFFANEKSDAFIKSKTKLANCFIQIAAELNFPPARLWLQMQDEHVSKYRGH